MILKGTAASAGIGIGKVYIVSNDLPDYSGVQAGSPEEEKQRLTDAIAQFRSMTEEMAEKTRIHVGEKEAGILEGQLEMIADPMMEEQMQDAIAGGSSAEAAAAQVLEFFASMMRDTGDEMMMQRASDIGDMENRILKILMGIEQISLSDLTEPTVLVAKDFTPSMTVGINKDMVAGILTETGGFTSHTAILARQMGLPAILGIPGVTEAMADAQTAAVDGRSGKVETDPAGEALTEWEEKLSAWKEELELLAQYREKDTVDADGRTYALYANIGSPEEARMAATYSAEGIGLFRSEFLFMDRTELPTEEEQYEAYKKASDAMRGREVIIRTLDVGGDKEISYLNLPKEENPFLGYRAIRFCLDREEMYRTQLRALLRAGAENKNIKIMVPLVTCVEEIRRVKELTEACKAELEAEGLAYDKDIAVGIMTETAASAQIADLLAKEADFFSIGTNDLIQYIMACDRGNTQIASLYSPFQPAVLRAIRRIIQSAKEAGIPVGMCGEAAADPHMIPLLMTWGLDEFSVGVGSVLSVRARIAGIHSAEAKELTDRVMQAATLAEVRDILGI